MQVRDFIRQHGLTMTAQDLGRSTGHFGAGHHSYRCIISGAGGRPMTVDFHMNPDAHGKKLPDLEQVLDSVAGDASLAENSRDWKEVRDEFGMADAAARRIYEACKREAADLRALLGPDAFRVLLEEVERL